MLPEGHSPGPPEGSGSVFPGAERQRPGVEEWGGRRRDVRSNE